MDDEDDSEMGFSDSSSSVSSNCKMNRIFLTESKRLQNDAEMADQDAIQDRRREDSLRETLNHNSTLHCRSPRLVSEKLEDDLILETA